MVDSLSLFLVATNKINVMNLILPLNCEVKDANDLKFCFEFLGSLALFFIRHAFTDVLKTTK